LFKEQSGQNVLLFLPLKVLISLLFQGDKEHEGNVRGGTFLKGKWEYMYITGNLGKTLQKIIAHASSFIFVYMGI